jgi:hypothetical protein
LHANRKENFKSVKKKKLYFAAGKLREGVANSMTQNEKYKMIP